MCFLIKNELMTNDNFVLFRHHEVVSWSKVVLRIN
jgi:hypothetical protein